MKKLEKNQTLVHFTTLRCKLQRDPCLSLPFLFTLAVGPEGFVYSYHETDRQTDTEESHHVLSSIMQEKGLEALIEKLPKNVGFGIGLEFRESSCLLNAKNANLVKAGMAFNVTIGMLAPIKVFPTCCKLQDHTSSCLCSTSPAPPFADLLACSMLQVWLIWIVKMLTARNQRSMPC